MLFPSLARQYPTAGLAALGERPDSMMEVLVFKTSVTRPRHIRQLAPGLAAFGRWNFDLDDCDNILRVEAGADEVPSIIALLAGHGFRREELPD